MTQMPRMPPGFPQGMPPGLQNMMQQGGGMPAGMMPRGMPRSQAPANRGVNLEALHEKHGVDPKRWRCVYPCYLNADYTIQQGRKIAKKFCVKRPHPMDIAEVCKYLGLPYYIELNKTHPRDFFNQSRVRVLIKKQDGSLRRDDIPNRYSLLIALGKMIPKLESRKRRIEQQKAMLEKRQEMVDAKMKEIEAIEEKKKQKKQHKESKKTKKGGNRRSAGRGRGRGRKKGGNRRR